jgi:hypothetical protein
LGYTPHAEIGIAGFVVTTNGLVVDTDFTNHPKRLLSWISTSEIAG